MSSSRITLDIRNDYDFQTTNGLSLCKIGNNKKIQGPRSQSNTIF